MIHYGEYFFQGSEGGAIAPKIATPISQFDIAVRGTAGDHEPQSILQNRDTDLDVKVWSQASGAGNAAVVITDEVSALGAGDMGREFTITYTAVGELIDGALKLTVPENWSAPTSDNVVITWVASAPPSFGGDYGEDDTLPEGSHCSRCHR